MSPTARRATSADSEAVLDVVVAAFTTEPAVQYFFGDGYARHAPTFFRFLFDLRIDGGQVWVTESAGEVSAVAMWQMPGGVALPKSEQHQRWETAASTFPDDIRGRLESYDDFLEEHHPKETDHYYLGVLATEPARQGQGLATAVMTPIFTAADASGVSCFLETGTPDNVGYYERHHFAVEATVDLPDGPRIWWMHRPPQKDGSDGSVG